MRRPSAATRQPRRKERNAYEPRLSLTDTDMLRGVRHRTVPESFSIPINPDKDGWVGRECPQSECLGYFKVTIGSGLSGNPECYCPYCGHKGLHNTFWTHEQIEYAKSVVAHEFSKALLADLKELEFDHKPRGAFGIGISMKVQGQPLPIRAYREERLETEVTCAQCTLRYAVYGALAYCSDCGVHNSLQIPDKTLTVVEKTLDLTSTLDTEIAKHIVANALEYIVGSTD